MLVCEFSHRPGICTRNNISNRGLRLAGHGRWSWALYALEVVIIIAIEAMSARHNYRRSKNLIIDYEPLGLKELRKGKDVEVTVEEHMLRDVDLSYSRDH